MATCTHDQRIGTGDLARLKPHLTQQRGEPFQVEIVDVANHAARSRFGRHDGEYIIYVEFPKGKDNALWTMHRNSFERQYDVFAHDDSMFFEP